MNCIYQAGKLTGEEKRRLLFYVLAPLVGFLVLGSFIKIGLGQQQLGGERRLAEEEGASGDGGGGTHGGGKDESARGGEGDAGPGGEEQRLRRGGEQAHSQSQSNQTLRDGIYRMLILQIFNLLVEEVEVVVCIYRKTLTITFMVKLLCFLFLW